MCGGGGGGGYDARDAARDREAARREAEAQRIAAENKAQIEANAQVAAKRVRSRANTLMTRTRSMRGGTAAGSVPTGSGTGPAGGAYTLMTRAIASTASKLGGT